MITALQKLQVQIAEAKQQPGILFVLLQQDFLKSGFGQASLHSSSSQKLQSCLCGTGAQSNDSHHTGMPVLCCETSMNDAIHHIVIMQVGAGKRVFQLLDRTPHLTPHGTLRPTGVAGGGHIKFQNVWFAYPSRPSNWVLQGINLEVMPGQKLALVGSSGGGKSTIVNLMQVG